MWSYDPTLLAQLHSRTIASIEELSSIDRDDRIFEQVAAAAAAADMAGYNNATPPSTRSRAAGSTCRSSSTAATADRLT